MIPVMLWRKFLVLKNFNAKETSKSISEETFSIKASGLNYYYHEYSLYKFSLSDLHYI